MYEALSYYGAMRAAAAAGEQTNCLIAGEEATAVWGLKLLVYEALSH